ncbi:MAG TPA: glycosyltransferase [Abditibacteriaceae bacterium]|nr:glycosyltransferase [Abditibacteriaceae bacterium]
MKSPPLKISVIIPTLCEAGRISRLLESLCVQEYSGPVEVIVVDGNSDDGTHSEVGQFPEVRLLVRETAGTSAQRNLGAAAATGDLLIFMDADNNPPPDFLTRVARSYCRKPFAVACPWFVADSRHPGIRLIYFVFNCLFWLSQWRFHTGSGVCIIMPRATFLQVGGFNEELRLGEDIDLIRRAARCGRHRHLFVPLRTSARRFERFGIWNMVRFYARISPLLLSGNFSAVQDFPYEPAPYRPPQR